MCRKSKVRQKTAEATLESAVGDADKDWRMAQGLSGPGSRIYSDLARNKPYSAGAEALRGVGIPGVKYLDQFSRSAGEGSRNYVVFNDAIIDILRKYGLAGALGGAAASSMYGSQPAEAKPSR